MVYTTDLDREGELSDANSKGEARCRFIPTNSGFFPIKHAARQRQVKNHTLNLQHPSQKQYNYTKQMTV
jgi:hypothetical protein